MMLDEEEVDGDFDEENEEEDGIEEDADDNGDVPDDENNSGNGIIDKVGDCIVDGIMKTGEIICTPLDWLTEKITGWM
jgi:hypothetical protein